MTVRILVFASVAPELAHEFEHAYTQVTARMQGTPGLLGDELLRDGNDPGRYLLLSEWESEEQFLAWESAPAHREITVPMRPYWSGNFERRIYNLAARLEPKVPVG
ncbi:antibiotic biosynthesis monooxygenase family protein [Candidatus Protofrankia californiensis]|uniref:antibiotic biosynthesis monooxygenase family protein n=1 Tax=Candidatus Protofrankia californiensis TaxID=1839754 RepID=UPI0010412184|nr:antibiotic biosynthesis monooxygenase family protein [Candidatus Protofrankia californiensis]